GVDGVALNQAVLTRMRDGETAVDAAQQVLLQNPGADAGIIALGLTGEAFAGNSAYVQRRGDLGRALIDDASSNSVIAVIHNAIHPHYAIADLAASIALDLMKPADRGDFFIEIAAGTPIELGDVNGLDIDDHDRAVRITVTHPSWLGPGRDGAVIDFAAEVRREGRIIGYTIAEPYCIMREGRLMSLSGRERVTIGVRAVDDGVTP
ncbi:MAG: hypothetical protein AAGA73_24845, partial [Pseudomonadota bacterium]